MSMHGVDFEPSLTTVVAAGGIKLRGRDSSDHSSRPSTFLMRICREYFNPVELDSFMPILSFFFFFFCRWAS